MNSYSLDQAFLKLRGGQLEFLFVLENPAGARHRETLQFPTRNSVEAVERAGKHLAYRGDVTRVRGVRLRVERSGELKDDASLQRMLVNAFEHYYETEDDA